MAVERTWLKYLDSFQQDMVRALRQLGYEAMLYSYKAGNKGEYSTDEKIKPGHGHVWSKKSRRQKSRSLFGRWKNRTFNLHDSYASAVYVNGKVASIRYLGSPKSTKRDRKTGRTGRQTAKDYIMSHRFGSTNDEIVLVVIAAMYYAKILEKGASGDIGPQGNFAVVSPAEEYIDKMYNAAVGPVFRKYGLKQPVRTRVIKGQNLKKM
jgi:hypothetical protein